MKKIDKIEDLIGLKGISQNNTPKNKKGLIYIANGHWEFVCPEDVEINDELGVVDIFDNNSMILLVKKIRH